MEMQVEYGEPSEEMKAYLADPVAYANEHPHEAERLHDERKAKRQAALREEYEKKREEILEALSETNRAKNVVIAILATIVVITVMIDFGASYVMKSCNDFCRPVIVILFKELSVLGCIALLIFMTVKTGFPQRISEAASTP